MKAIIFSTGDELHYISPPFICNDEQFSRIENLFASVRTYQDFAEAIRQASMKVRVSGNCIQRYSGESFVGFELYRLGPVASHEPTLVMSQMCLCKM